MPDPRERCSRSPAPSSVRLHANSTRYDDPFSSEALHDILSDNPAHSPAHNPAQNTANTPAHNPDDPVPFSDGHPLNVLAPDYMNPLSDDAPLDTDRRTRWLETVYRECMNRGQYHAAVRALDLIARLEGIRPPAQTPQKAESPANQSANQSVNPANNQPGNQHG